MTRSHKTSSKQHHKRSSKQPESELITPKQENTGRDFDIVVYGATGFTGELIAEYLMQTYGLNGEATPIRWAIAGRNQTKLELLRQRLRGEAEKLLQPGGLGELEIIVTEANDAARLESLTKRTRVVISTVGPYMKYGLPLLTACVENETHYVDLAGEIPFIRDSIDRFSETAIQKKIKIVHGCGFDALPSDIGVMVLQDFIFSETGEYADHVEMIVEQATGGISSGTIGSMSNLFEWVCEDKSRMQLLNDPYSLNDDKDDLVPQPDRRRPHFDTYTQSWIAPFLMGTFNTRIVRRTNELLGYKYGKSFLYNEGIKAPNLIPTRLQEKLPRLTANDKVEHIAGTIGANLLTIGVGGLTQMMLHAPTRDIIRNLHSILVGNPSAETRHNGRLQLLFYARKRGTNDEIARTVIHGTIDPGYGGTAIMIAESAVSLALDPLPSEGGVLTPASLGHHIVNRLKNSDLFTFESTLTNAG